MDLIDQMMSKGIKPGFAQSVNSVSNNSTLSLSNSEQPQSNDLIDKMQSARIKPSQTDTTGFQSLMAGISSFNNRIEQITTLPYKAGLLGQDIKSKADTYMENQAAEIQGLQKINPTSIAIGNAAANLGMLSVAATAGPAGLLEGSATIGGLTGAVQPASDLTEHLGNTLKGTITGTATGITLGGLGKIVESTGLPKLVGTGIQKLTNLISNVQTVAPLMTKSADDIYSMAVKQAGGENAINASLESAQNAFTGFVNQARMTKNMLYGIRDQIAKENNITIGNSSLSNILSDNNKFLDPQAKSFANSLLKSQFGKNDSISFDMAKGMLSNLKGKVEGTKLTDPGLSNSYNTLASAFQQDIDKSLNSIPALQNASNIADSFNSNTYAPLQNTMSKFKLQDGLTNQNFMNGFLKASQNAGSSQYKAFQVLPQDVKQQMVMAHFNALKDAQTSATELNVNRYATTLLKTTNQNPILSQSGIDVNSIANAISAKGLVARANPGEIGKEIVGAAIGGGLAGGSAAATGAVGGFMVQKLGFLNAAGKLLNDESVQPVLQTLRNSDNLAKPLVDNLTSKLASAFTSYYMTSQHDEPQQPTEAAGIRD